MFHSESAGGRLSTLAPVDGHVAGVRPALTGWLGRLKLVVSRPPWRPCGGSTVGTGGLYGQHDVLPIGEGLGGMPAAGSFDRLGLRDDRRW